VRINSRDDLATSCKNLVNHGSVTPEMTWLIFIPILGENRPVRLHSSRWHSKTCRMIGMPMFALTAAMIDRINSGVNAAQLCTAGVDHLSGYCNYVR